MRPPDIQPNTFWDFGSFRLLFRRALSSPGTQADAPKTPLRNAQRRHGPSGFSDEQRDAEQKQEPS